MTDKEFYSPGEISFRREQVLFMLYHFELLMDISWPPDRKETGYTGKKGRRPSRTAYFEKVAEVTAELIARLDMVGRDALPLLISYSQELEQQYYIRDFLARCLRIEVTELDKRIESALKFVSGKERKQRSYKQFRQHKKGD